MADRSSRPAVRIALSIDNAAWLRRVPDARARCRRLVRAALAAAGFDARQMAGADSAELSLVLGDDALLQRLNRDFRGKNKPTNVLSFPAIDVTERGMKRPVFPLGDVAIAYETSASEAREQGKTLSDHLSHLVVHGVLHLLGYDHLTKAQANNMETLETAVLARIGLSDPYRARVPRKPRRVPRTQRSVPRKQPRAARPRT
jgi:probable rRNA maturation factor